MKKILMAFLITLFAGVVFAQGFTVNGEIKTGLYWSRYEDGLNEPLDKAYFHSRDDAGDDYSNKRDATNPVPGRFQIDVAYLNNNIGFKTRFRWEGWLYDKSMPIFNYAFGYGNFFDDQFTLSLGKLGASPWGTGGPEMWKELEISTLGGMRFEIKPHVVPGLNAGFVLNYFNSNMDKVASGEDTLADYLMESVIGVSYTHDLFHVRFAYRLDSDRDIRETGVRSTTSNEGGELVYRVEEYALRKYLPGLSIWALGYYIGVGAEAADFVTFQNWLFTQYDTDYFTAQIRFGFEGSRDRNIISVRPNFFYKLFNGLIEFGALFGYGQDLGAKIYPGSPYSYLEVQPKLQINFAPGAYVAFEYDWKLEYAFRDPPPLRQTQWINLRFGIYY